MRLAKRLNGEPANRERQDIGLYGHASNGHHFDGEDRMVGRDHGAEVGDGSPKPAVVEFVAELKNHLTVLDGILSPLYSGEAFSLQPAERRMIRYLMTEIGGVCRNLAGVESPTDTVLGTRRKTRAAV